MRTTFLILWALAAWAGTPAWAQKTDLASERYLEASKSDFDLTVKVTAGANKKVVVFEVAAPAAGPHTLLCYVDGKFWTRKQVNLPAKYPLNVSGLAPGTHRITLQAVDASGRVCDFECFVPFQKGIDLCSCLFNLVAADDVDEFAAVGHHRRKSVEKAFLLGGVALDVVEGA